MVLKKVHFKLGMDEWKGQKQGREKKTQEHHLLRNDDGFLSGFQCNAFASLVHFAHNKVNYRDGICIALEARYGMMAASSRVEAAIIPYK